MGGSLPIRGSVDAPKFKDYILHLEEAEEEQTEASRGLDDVLAGLSLEA